MVRPAKKFAATGHSRPAVKMQQAPRMRHAAPEAARASSVEISAAIPLLAWPTTRITVPEVGDKT